MAIVETEIWIRQVKTIMFWVVHITAGMYNFEMLC